MAKQKMIKKTRFISVEIEIKTNDDSIAFVKWFEEKDNYVTKKECDTHKWHIYFDPLPQKNANLTIKSLCDVIQNLPPDVRKEWDKAEHRKFYAGYEVGDEPHWFPEHFELETLEASVALGASIGFALYAAQPTTKDGLPAELT